MTENTIQDHRIISPISVQDMMSSFLICSAALLLFFILDSKLLHWCMLPLFICGVIMGTDAVRWLRGGVDTFDPKGIIGMFGLNFFFFAPLLFLYNDLDLAWVYNPPDWRPWIGIMGSFNVAGVIAYQISHLFAFKHCRPSKKIWVTSAEKGKVILWIAVFLSIVTWVIFLWRMGGFAGIIRQKLYDDISVRGLGTFRFFSIALMPLLLITLTVQRKSNTRTSILYVIVILVICGVIQFLTAGLGGSRLRVMSPFLWAVGIIHYRWRDIAPKQLVLGMVPVVVFAFIYGIYKAGHERFIDMLRGQTTLSEVMEATHENIPHVLAGDLSRTSVQAWMLYKWFNFREDYNLRYGTTYLQAPVALAPKWLFKWKVEGGSFKTRAGTEYLYGKGYFVPGKRRMASYIYGLAGEAILNFGLWSIPFAFVVWGLLIGWLRRKWISWPLEDSRFLIMPWLSILAISLLSNDSDVTWSIITSQVIIPSIVVFFVSSRIFWGNGNPLESEVEMGYEISATASY